MIIIINSKIYNIHNLIIIDKIYNKYDNNDFNKIITNKQIIIEDK